MNIKKKKKKKPNKPEVIAGQHLTSLLPGDKEDNLLPFLPIPVPEALKPCFFSIIYGKGL